MTINQSSLTRVDTLQIKELIHKKVGDTKFETYIALLREFFSAGLSTGEFSKLCIQTIGRENIPLHNELIKGILKNVCSAGVPSSKDPSTTVTSSAKVGSKRGRKPKAIASMDNDAGLITSSDVIKPKRGRKRKDPPSNDTSLITSSNVKPKRGRKRKDPPLGCSSLSSSLDVKTPDGCQVGNPPPAISCLAPSPRKARTTINRASRFKKCTVPPVPVINQPDSILTLVPETPEQPCIGSSRAAVESSEDAEQIAETPGVQSVNPITVPCIGSSRAAVESSEDADRIVVTPGLRSLTPITAPFGISNNLFGPSKAKALCETFVRDCRSETCSVKGELPNTVSLKIRLDRMLRMEGMNISLDGANLLNKALDLYLKRIIKPITDLSRMRSPASTQDFSTAMALNPQVLGEHWPGQLERTSLRL